MKFLPLACQTGLPRIVSGGMTARYLPDPALLSLTAEMDPPRDPRVRADVIRLALASFAAARGYDRFAAVVRSVDGAHLGTLLLALTDGWCFHGWDLDSEFERDCRRWVKLVASSTTSGRVRPSERSERRARRQSLDLGCTPIPLLEDDTFVRLCEVAADVYTWEGGGDQSKNFDIEFDEYVRPAWLVLGDELEYEKATNVSCTTDNERPVTAERA